jgi:hypothetical protein
MWVPPFGDLRVKGCLLLTAAFLGSMGSLSYRAEARPHHLSALTPRLSLSGPMDSAYRLEPGCGLERGTAVAIALGLVGR